MSVNCVTAPCFPCTRAINSSLERTRSSTFASIERCDFRLRAGSPGIDRGEKLPNFSDGYTGAAPDMGAFEQGANSGLMPLRPISLSVDSTELRFKPSQLGGNNEKLNVTLTLPPGAPKEARFVIRKNEVFGWLRVEPAQGVLRKGESVRLTVSLDHAAIAKPHDNKGLGLVKLEVGLAVPVSVYARVGDSRYYRAAEAEQLSGDQLKIVSDAAASGGKFVELGDDEAKGFDYTFEVPLDGYYFAFLRVKNATARRQAASNTMYARNLISAELDGTRHIIGLRSRLTNVWEWNPIQVVSEKPLKAGKHTLRIISREPVDIDRIVLSSDPFDLDAKK